MKLLISGLCGHMGAEVAQLVQNHYLGAEPEGTVGVDPNACGAEGMPCALSFEEADRNPAVFASVDAIVDFSFHGSVVSLLPFALRHHLPVVIATTGHSEAEKALITDAAGQIPVFFAANFSMGVALLIDSARRVAAAMPDAEIEIIETHHDRKLDAPSGTALAIADALKEVRPDARTVVGRNGHEKREKTDIGISSVRIGQVVGRHEVIIATANQTITLTHEAHDRALFAEGALAAAAFLAGGKQPGLYTMPDLIAGR